MDKDERHSTEGLPSERLPVCPLAAPASRNKSKDSDGSMERALVMSCGGSPDLANIEKYTDRRADRLPKRPQPSSLLGPAQVVMEDSWSRKTQDCLGSLVRIRKHLDQNQEGWGLCGSQPIAGQ